MAYNNKEEKKKMWTKMLIKGRDSVLISGRQENKKTQAF